MWISEIRINNFRPFYGNQKIIFKENSQENFTIIEAKSDTGKTTLLSAICWCLYGKDLGESGIDSSGSEYRSIHPFNLDRKDELREGNRDNLEVEITLNKDGDKNPKYMLTRIASCVKHEDEMDYDGETFLRVEEWEGHKASTTSDPVLNKKIINSIIPEDIHMFFLFEGEKLEKIFSFNKPENIQEAIEKISQIQQVKSAIEHMEAVRIKIYTDKSKGKSDKDIQEAERNIEDSKQKMEALEKQKSIYVSGLQKAEDRIREIDTKLSNVNAPLISEWSRNRTELEKRIDELDKELISFQDVATESLLKYVPLSLVNNAIKNLLNRIEATSQRNELPPKIKNMYITELLNKEICICGRSLNAKENEDAIKAREVLNGILKENDLSDLAERLIEGRYTINHTLNIIPTKLIKERDSKINHIEEIKNKIKINQANIEDLTKKLSEYKLDDINNLNNERITLKSSRDSQLKSITRLEFDINREKDEIIRKKRIIDELARNLKDYNSKKKIVDFIDRAHEHLEKINNEILEEVRKKVEKKTFDSFVNLHWDKVNYKEFSIDSEYKMSLKDPNGNERIYNIASGTKQVLLLSFIAALAEVSGFKFPIFIDTPLANTDNSQRENIANNLPDYLKGNQVVLLVKDQEYTAKFRSLIKERVSQELRLVKNGGRTEVKPWA